MAALVGKPDFSAIGFTINGSVFALGDFINALVSFLLVAAAVYFFVVLPVNALLARMHRSDTSADPTTKKCPECLSEIPLDARRCSHCAQPLVRSVAAD
ncbi:MAG: MscL family protein [Acidobacteriota bacterium]